MPDSKGATPGLSAAPDARWEVLIARAETGVDRYLAAQRDSGELAQNYYDDAVRNVIPNLHEWLTDPEIDRLSPHLKRGVAETIEAGRWSDLVNAFARKMKFGTGGIRALMAFDKGSIEALMRDGIDARILKGPNTINNIVVMQAAWGVARYFVEHTPGGAPKAVVGYDSRVQGAAFARAIAEVFLSEGLIVHLFDEAVPYPEVTFAIPTLEADFGVFISASHNDYRYNGFKMSGANGAQIDYRVRDVILAKIRAAKPEHIRTVSLETAGPEVLARLHYLGGDKPLAGYDYHGRAGSLVDMHSELVRQIKKFLLRHELLDPATGTAGKLAIVYSAFNGSGRRVVPRILDELGFKRVHKIASLEPLNGLFPAFKSDPGEEQQPDPGDPRAAVIALKELAKDQKTRGALAWADADLLIGTDPDADRCGVVVKPPRAFAERLRGRPGLRYSPEHVLIPADDMWALIVWYRLQHEIEREGAVRDAGNKFLAMSHTTSDMIARVVAKHGIGVLKTWVGFGWLSTGVAEAWKGQPLPVYREGRQQPSADPCDRVFFDTTGMGGRARTLNIATLEQSNGFSILGGPPADGARQMGAGGHVRDKDGTFASLLVAEIAAYARSLGTDILSLLARHIYSDPAVGLFVNAYEPDPLDGEYPGLAGDTKKKAILDRAIALGEEAKRGGLTLGRREVTGTAVYWTAKYDAENFPGFPDEGIRFYFGGELDHLTIRPSGTTNSLRFHVQYFAGAVPESEAWGRRLELETEAKQLLDDLRQRLGAPRQAGVEY